MAAPVPTGVPATTVVRADTQAAALTEGAGAKLDVISKPTPPARAAFLFPSASPHSRRDIASYVSTVGDSVYTACFSPRSVL